GAAWAVGYYNVVAVGGVGGGEVGLDHDVLSNRRGGKETRGHLVEDATKDGILAPLLYHSQDFVIALAFNEVGQLGGAGRTSALICRCRWPFGRRHGRFCGGRRDGRRGRFGGRLGGDPVYSWHFGGARRFARSAAGLL